MLQSEKDYITETVDREGFDYAFRYYDTFDIVRDKEFHRLRKAYIDAAKKLAEYLELAV